MSILKIPFARHRVNILNLGLYFKNALIWTCEIYICRPQVSVEYISDSKWKYYLNNNNLMINNNTVYNINWRIWNECAFVLYTVDVGGNMCVIQMVTYKGHPPLLTDFSLLNQIDY